MAKYTFTAEDANSRATVECEGVTITCVAEAFRQFLLAAGFHHDNVADVFGDSEVSEHDEHTD